MSKNTLPSVITDIFEQDEAINPDADTMKSLSETIETTGEIVLRMFLLSDGQIKVGIKYQIEDNCPFTEEAQFDLMRGLDYFTDVPAALIQMGRQIRLEADQPADNDPIH